MFEREQYKTFETSTKSQLYYVLDDETFYITTNKEGCDKGWWFGPKALKETAEFLLGLAAQLETKKED